MTRSIPRRKSRRTKHTLVFWVSRPRHSCPTQQSASSASASSFASSARTCASTSVWSDSFSGPTPKRPRDAETKRPDAVALRAERAEPMVGGRCRQDRSLKYRSGSNGLQSTDPPSTGKSLGPHHEPRSRTAKQPLLVRRKLTHSSSAPEEDFEVFFFLRSLQLTYPF